MKRKALGFGIAAPAAEARPTAAAASSDPFVDWLVEKLGLPREEVLSEIEEAAAKNPVFRNQFGALRSFMEKAYDMLAGNTVQGLAEALAILQTGSGVVDPNVGDTA